MLHFFSKLIEENTFAFVNDFVQRQIESGAV